MFIKQIIKTDGLPFEIFSIVSNEITNYFVNFNSTDLVGKTLMFDLTTYNRNIVKWEQNKNCKVCGTDDSK